ncbi:MAG: VapC toxin family PIN domain ribonuclease [Gammaproteobacteria bacterium]|nr:MAG: VapC toxin family PIN domain ribonuclease [Gammaproteobacteria bacterium]
MNLVDTSAYLEFFAGKSNVEHFLEPITQIKKLIIPTICIYEISKVILRESNQNSLTKIFTALDGANVVDLNIQIATDAAKNSRKYKLPMADSIIFTTAQQYKATIWTQDVDFKDLPNVRYFKKIK